MSVDLTVSGVVFPFPEPGDDGDFWGPAVTAWATAVSASALYKAGGNYSLSSEADFGPAYGLKSIYYKSRTANPAAAGQVRLANADTIRWRNQANGADLELGVNSLNQLTYLGVPLATSQITVADTSTIDLTLTGVDLSAAVIAASLSNTHIAPDAAIAYSKLNLATSIVNADVNASAAIAYSKLALTGSILNADVNASAAIAYSKLALTGSILNADVNASAAIAYSKLALTGSIVNADINASAAIAKTKLALTNTIVNADINSAAAIAYSKLALSNSIVNADIATGAAIAYAKLNLATSIVNADVSASAAIAYSKLALTGSILNADIAPGAAIAYSKLNLATSIVNADVSASAAIAYSKLNLATSIVNADVSASAAIAYSKLNLATSIVNADVSASAAIARSKLAALTASRVLVSDGSGFDSASSVTSTTLAFLDATSSIQTQIDSKRTMLLADRTYYVRTDGSNSNTGLVDSAGGAFLTIQKAIDTAYTLDLNGFAVTIQVRSGTFTTAIIVNRPFVGRGSVSIAGDTTTPSNVVLSITSNTVLAASGGADIRIRGVKITTTTAGHGITVTERSRVLIDGLFEFGAVATGYYQAYMDGPSSVLAITSNYTISGGASRHWSVEYGAYLQATGITITLTGTPAFASTFIGCTGVSIAKVYSITFSGSATGPRYFLTTNAYIETAGGGANYFPGNSAGSSGTGGQYA